MNTPENAPSVAPAAAPRQSPALRVVRFVALLGLTLILTLFLGLAVVALSPTAGTALQSLVFANVAKLPILPGVLTLAFIVLVPIALLVAVWRLRLTSWWWLVGGYALTAPVLVYLAWDDPVVRRPVTFEEISPVFPGAEKSFEVLMRYGKQHPASAEFAKWKPAVVGLPKNPSDGSAWREFVIANRAGFEADWAALVPQRAWWSELNRFERIGDLTPARFDAEIVSFLVYRTVSQKACAIASLQAIDGQGDAAIATLLPILEVGHKLEPSARTLVRFMIGRVIQGLAINTANFVLDQATVSPAARARLAAALQGAGGGETGARRMITIEYAWAVGGSHAQSLGNMMDGGFAGRGRQWFRLPLNLVGPFVYNPRATLNLYGALNAELQELAAHRDLGKFGLREKGFFAQEARPHFKNAAGALLVWQMQPAYTKVLETYWKIEDKRAALLARLAK